MLQMENSQSSVCRTACRAGSAQPVAFNTPYDDEGESGSQGHHERPQQREAVQHRGPGGLMSHMYNRKLEQAQQVVAILVVLAQPTHVQSAAAPSSGVKALL